MPIKAHCQSCDQPFDLRRKQLGYNFCLECGDYHASKQRAGWTVVADRAQARGTTPRITNHADLKGLNQEFNSLTQEKNYEHANTDHPAK